MHSDIVLCATGKTGIGHLRRLTNIADAIKGLCPSSTLRLLTNADPGGLVPGEIALYDRIDQMPRAAMADTLVDHRRGPIVVDTAVLPGLHCVDAPLCLVLRETAADKVDRFQLEAGRKWDLVVLPNPADDWTPGPESLAAQRVEPVGWIYRAPSDQNNYRLTLSDSPGGTPRTLLVASGGGGNRQTAAYLNQEIGEVLERAVSLAPCGYEVVQVMGPRAPGDLRLLQASRIIHPGPRLHALFPQADMVVSTAGYNSVLELACTDVPTLLVPIPRAMDDQVARAQRWGKRLGRWHEPGAEEESAHWICETLAAGRRRPPVMLGSSGAGRAAELILALQ